MKRLSNPFVAKCILGSIFLATGTAQMCILIFWLDNSYLLPLIVGFCALFIPLFSIGAGKVDKMPIPLSALPLILLGFWAYFIFAFGFFDWASIIYHANADLDDSNAIWFYAKMAAQPTAGILMLITGFVFLKKNNIWFASMEKWIAALILVINPAVSAAASDLTTTKNNPHNGELLSLYKHPEIKPKAGVKPANFLHIYLESTERTYNVRSDFGNIMEPLETMEKHGFTATDMYQIADTGWSVAGMGAAMCGVPLSQFGIAFGNSFDVFSKYMPNATCIGDLLKHHDYDLTFLVGANTGFAGTDKLYLDHSFDRVLGVKDVFKMFPDKTNVEGGTTATNWGAYDDLVYDSALKLLRKKKASGKPFGLSVITTGGHAPLGNLSSSCEGRKDIMAFENNIQNAIMCTNTLLVETIEKAKAEGLLDNTIIIVQSDHLSMKTPMYDKLLKNDRRNLFFAMGNGIDQQVHTKPSSMIDVYPTLLEMLGFDVKERRAGLGVSLLSDKPTLIEQHGIDGLNARINGDTDIRKMLWEKPSGS